MPDIAVSPADIALAASEIEGLQRMFRAVENSATVLKVLASWQNAASELDVAIAAKRATLAELDAKTIAEAKADGQRQAAQIVSDAQATAAQIVSDAKTAAAEITAQRDAMAAEHASVTAQLATLRKTAAALAGA